MESIIRDEKHNESLPAQIKTLQWMVWSHEFLDNLNIFQTSLECCEQKGLNQIIQKLKNTPGDVDFNIKYLRIFCVTDKFWLFS